MRELDAAEPPIYRSAAEDGSRVSTHQARGRDSDAIRMQMTSVRMRGSMGFKRFGSDGARGSLLFDAFSCEDWLKRAGWAMT